MYRLRSEVRLRGMIKELNSTGLTDYSNNIKKVCTKGCVEKLKVVTYLTQEKARDFGTTFRVQERATKKMLNG